MKVAFKLLTRWVSLLLPAALLASEALAGSAVQWPHGWERHSVPMPTSGSGEHFDGSNQLALKMDRKGQLEAALNLSILKIKGSDMPNLDDQTTSMIATIRDGYAAKGLQAACDTSQRTTLGDIQARQTRCHVRKDNTEVLTQEIVVALGVHTAQSLSYTAQPEKFQIYAAEFAAMRDRLRQD